MVNMRKILKNIRNVQDVRRRSIVQKNVKLQIGRFINILVIRRKNSHLVYMVYLLILFDSVFLLYKGILIIELLNISPEV